MLTASQTYRNSDFFGLVDGLNFALQYQGKNGKASAAKVLCLRPTTVVAL
ncbi:porin [Klebsiella pneumoniae]|nr:porin [Klebsiella pneumoniae]